MPAPSKRKTVPARPRAADKLPTTRGAERTVRRRPPPPPRPSRARRVLSASLKVGAVLFVLGLVAVVSVVAYYSRDLPDVATLRAYDPPQITRVVDRHGAVIGELYDERRTVIPIERIPRVMVLAILASEDADFYRHPGVDYVGILRAILRDLSSGRAAQGASTITQQVVKLLLLSPERTFSRKVRELILAYRVEAELTKDEILHLYLNHINFGQGRYGVQEAAQFYFGKNAEELTLAEASLLAGIPQSPTRLNPRRHPEAARRRQLYVLGQLEAKREDYWPDLSLEDITAARETEVALVDLPESGAGAPEVMAIARQALREHVDAEAYRRGGFTVHTSVDLELQQATRAAVRGGLEAIDGRHAYRGPLRASRGRGEAAGDLRLGRTYVGRVVERDNQGAQLIVAIGETRVAVSLEDAARYNPSGLSAEAFAEEGASVHVSLLQLPGEDDEGLAPARFELGPEAAAVVIDPRTRDVLAIVGGYDDGAGFNRALQAVRQPGSTFKPFVYGLGIQSRRYTPATLVIDAPAVYDQWQPQNFETWRHRGPIRLRDALAGSVNVVAVRVIEDLEPSAVAAFAARLGITTELDPSIALALGASGARPIEMTNAYATFAAGGRWAPTRIVTRIEGPAGDIALPAPEPARDVMTPAEAYVLTSMLTSVVESGTAQRARALRRPAAGKTGTSNDACDAWFIGYTPSVVTGVWVGFDDRRPIGRNETGGRAALPIWLEIMQAAHHGPAVDFPMPSGVVTASIDPASGLLAYSGMEGARSEVFVDGTVPTEEARRPEVAAPDAYLLEQFGGSP
ncbi:MAG: PBP1A family penicillin-binding protein [Sandaracinaceae bacterium]|nr:PBP1A family penicillin-binding protein [Myxococcales bacterium]MCB9657297.1 PBP1A family penicillin-binding protein [Sandaracinaceae bacterium]